jgi:hypothetical protein
MGSLGSYSRASYQFREHRPGTLCGIAQGLEQPIDGDVDPVIDVHKSVRRPKLLPALLLPSASLLSYRATAG